MTDLLSLGLTGLKASGRAMSTISDNIANTETPGYARRSIRLTEASPGGDTPLHRTQFTPSGVAVAGVSRFADPLMIEDSRVASSASGQSSTRLAWIEAAERGLDDGTGGIGATLTRFFNTADQLATNPGSQSLRATFLQNVDDIASSFRQTAASLESTANAIGAEANVQVDALNADLTALQRVNEGLLRARDGSNNQNSLFDERDRILDRLADKVAISSQIDGRGMATVSLAGPSGTLLVSLAAVNPMSVAVAADGTLSFSTATGGPASPMSGSLAGLSQAASHLRTPRDGLDRLSGQVVSQLNAVHQIGIDAQGNPGLPLFTFDGDAASLAANSLTPPQVAAADGSSSNGNLHALSSLRGASGVEAGWASLVTTNASAVASARAQDAAAVARRDGAWGARDAVSGVSLDHEAAELLRFQQAYEASARVIQVARETIQTIMNAL